MNAKEEADFLERYSQELRDRELLLSQETEVAERRMDLNRRSLDSIREELAAIRHENAANRVAYINLQSRLSEIESKLDGHIKVEENYRPILQDLKTWVDGAEFSVNLTKKILIVLVAFGAFFGIPLTFEGIKSALSHK